MIALEIKDIKDFMNKLLRSEIFDNFLLQEATIISGVSYVIDGHITGEFYTEAESKELGINNLSCMPYKHLRGQCFDLIKGKKTPLSFKFVFSLSPENQQKTIVASNSDYSDFDISGIFFNLKYQNQLLTLTTGMSYKKFSPDKSLEIYWDKMIQKFLIQHEISFEEL